MNKETNNPKGYAFVQYINPVDAVTALNAMDGKIFQGRLLHIIPAKTQAKEISKKKSGSEATTENNSTSSFKEKKQQELKSSASSSHNWNSLFMGVFKKKKKWPKIFFFSPE